MQPENFFFLIFLLTILITRVFLYFKPTPSPTIKGLRLHHYMFGLIILVFSLVMKNLILYSIGLGLFIDEFTFLLMRGKNHKDNYSKISLIGTAIFILIVFIFKKYIVLLIR